MVGIFVLGVVLPIELLFHHFSPSLLRPSRFTPAPRRQVYSTEGVRISVALDADVSAERETKIVLAVQTLVDRMQWERVMLHA